MKVDLYQMLDLYTHSALLALVNYRRLSVAGKTKEHLIEALLATMFDEEQIKLALATIDKRDREVLDRLLLHGGEVRTGVFHRELLRAGLVIEPAEQGAHLRASGSPYHAESRCFEDVIARLTAAGLVFSDRQSAWSGSGSKIELSAPGEQLFIPDQVMAHLPPAARRVPELPPVTVGEEEVAAPETFQRDVFLYWRFVRRDEVPLTSKDLVPKRHLAKITASLLVGENVEAAAAEHALGRTYFLRLMLQELGLLAEQDRRLVATSESPSFLALPLAERVRRCYLAWRDGDRWNELLWLEGVQLDVGSGAYREAAHPNVVEARQFVTSLLADFPPGRWIPLEHFWEQARIANYEFLFSRGRYRHDGYYFGRYLERNPYDGSENPLGWTFEGVRDDEEGWRTVEGGFIAAVLRDPLHWLGLVDLSYAEGRPAKGKAAEVVRRLAAFRLTELGARIIRGEPLPEVPSGGPVIVQPNFQIFAFDPVGEHVLAAIDRFADLVRAEQAVEFQLTRESVYRAQQDKMALEEIVGYLEEVSGRPLPQNVRRTLEEWYRHHERVVVHRGVNLIHCAAPELLDDLLTDPVVAPHLGRRLAPAAAVVTGKGPEALVGVLLARGYLPALSRRGEESVKEALAVAADGRIAFRQRAPSIFVWRRVAGFAEQREGALWLTPEAVQRAVKNGLDAGQIIRQLEEVHHGPLPSAVADRIKVWAKHWGDARLAVVSLLRVKDQAVLAELMADPAVGPLLRPYVPEGALAVVAGEDVAKLRAALEAKGIALLDGS